MLGLILLISSYLCWRLYRFSLVCVFFPDDPKVLPYLLPIVGHTLWFFTNPEGLHRYGNTYFAGSEPYCVFIGGKRFVIVREAHDVDSIWRETRSLTFDDMIQQMFDGVRIPRYLYLRMFVPDPGTLFSNREKPNALFVHENPLRKRYIDLQMEWFKQQFLGGERMNKLQTACFQRLDHIMHWDMIPERAILSQTLDDKVVSLYDWCRHAIIEVGTFALMGPELLKADPNFNTEYMKWEDHSWKVLYQHPDILSRGMLKAQKRLVDVLSQYYSQEPAKRPNLCWLFERMQSEQQKLGLRVQDAAGITIITLLGYSPFLNLFYYTKVGIRIHANTFRFLFWTLVHILADSNLRSLVELEVSAAYRDDGTIDSEKLYGSCPNLVAAWNEALRLYNVTGIIRRAESEVVLGGKSVHPGDIVLSPNSIVHFQRESFGDEAKDFSTARWLQRRTMPPLRSFHPFGGGLTYCPGRIFAKHEAFYFIALVMRRFEIQPKVEGGAISVPAVAASKPAIACSDPVGRVEIKLRPRRQSLGE
ncbi:hypothetical protein MMC27_005776 [Xylographa pallens]|nr:hypothetical protein [Xylographa pallens]